MRPTLIARTLDGRRHELFPGDFIGRLDRAALRIDHPAISEAHALVSARGEALWLRQLRGRIGLEG